MHQALLTLAWRCCQLDLVELLPQLQFDRGGWNKSTE
jgi:hypothetical protein